MYGAILGDIIGSPFEFDRGKKTKDFELFTRGCTFTDDTVMTIAVASALLSIDAVTRENVTKAVIEKMQLFGKKYPYSGYGLNFHKWLYSDNPQPYNSCGNGSAMRVSSVGWLYDTLEQTQQVAEWTAEVTHNHPEGIKGAVATASCIYLARTGKSKEYIKDYVEKTFGYDLSKTLDEIRPTYHHVEICQESVPQAIRAFLEGTDFEDTIRNVVSIGGDTDTLGAIAGGIAEAFFGVPDDLLDECDVRLDMGLSIVLRKFDRRVGR